MATQKALITDKSAFIQPGVEGLVVTPTLYSNAEDLPTGLTVNGSPTYTNGIRGKGIQHNNNYAYRWNDYYFASTTKKMLSLWIKPTATDVAINSGWKIIATNRGLGKTDFGFHLALYNNATLSQFCFRAYGTNGSITLYSDGTNGQTLMSPVANTWYHIVVIYDSSATNKFEVYINNVRILYSTTAINFGAFTRSFTVGDMLTSGGALQYPFGGIIDEVIFTDSSTWTTAQITTYYNAIIGSKMLDYWTEPGNLILALTPGGSYASGSYSWESAVIDLTTPFASYGRVQVNYDAPGGTTLIVSTAASADGIAWDAYVDINQDGTINSISKRYIKIKVTMATILPTVTPRLYELQVLDYSVTEILSLVNAPLKVYKDQASGLEYAGELTNAYDIIVDEEINGENTLKFKLPINDPKRKELGDEPVEMVVEIAGRRYIIRESVDQRDSNSVYTQFSAESFFYELNDFKVVALDLSQTTAFTAVTKVLAAAVPPCGWTLAKCEIPSAKLRDFKVDWKSVLGCLRDIVSTWGGELVFDDVAKEFSIITAQGQDKGVRFYYSKNLKKVVRTVSTYELITRLYPQGKNSLTIKTVNNNVEYIEDLTWVNALNLRNKIRVGQWKDESYIYPQNLLDDAQTILADSSTPRISYVLDVQDLSLLSGHENESFNLGDTVYTVDTDLLSMEVKSRIVRRTYNVRKPWLTVVELAQPKRMLSDAMRSSIEDKVQNLATSDLMDVNDAKQMTVFNYLLNSRADEGFASWAQVGTGFTVDTTSGFSGGASFKCTGAFNKSNTLTQRVYGVSHRSSYTVSAAIATEGTITKGGAMAEPFAGIKVVIHYDDGTSETKYLSMEEATSTEQAT